MQNANPRVGVVVSRTGSRPPATGAGSYLTAPDAATSTASPASALLDRPFPAASLAWDDNGIQIIVLVLEQGRASLESHLLALASSLFALLAVTQFHIGGTIPVIMINAGHKASHQVDVDTLVSTFRLHHGLKLCLKK